MKIFDLLEGGWDTAITQHTVIRPETVKLALAQIQRFITDFNAWLAAQDQGPVQLGRPTGSSTYHEIDAKEDPHKIYGDIDLQIIAPDLPGASYYQYSSHWNRLADEFVRDRSPSYVHQGQSKPGHPIIAIGPDQYVQVDFMWHPPRLQDWGAARATPERGVKGLLAGNFYSVLGELLDMSIQHAGVQFKTLHGQHVPFSKQKDTVVQTISTNPRTFIRDILTNQYQTITGQDPSQAKIDPLLAQYPGNDPQDVKISKLVNAIRGLARSFAANGLYGRGQLSGFRDADDFVTKFVQRYEAKAMADVNSAKRHKAQTPEAQARADSDRHKIIKGLHMVQALFNL